MRASLTFCLMALLLVAACSDDDGVGPQESGLTIEQFPIEVGDWWRYEVIDTMFSLSGEPEATIDTVLVQAAETLYVDCAEADCPGVYIRYLFDDGESQWFALVVANVDTLTMEQIRDLGTTALPWPGIRWHFPLEVGKTWLGNASSVSVVRRQQMVLPATDIVDSYLLHQEWEIPNEGGQSDVWVAPKVGIVRQHFSHYCTVCSFWSYNSTWQLIDWFGRYPPLD